MQKQRNIAADVRASASVARSSSISLEMDQQFVVIEEANPPSEMRKAVVPSEQQFVQDVAVKVQSLNLPLAPNTQERSIV